MRRQIFLSVVVSIFLARYLAGAVAGGLLANAATQPIAVIVNKANVVTVLPKSSLGRVYNGKMTHWEDGQKVVAFNHPIDAEIRRQFYTSVLATGPTTKFFIPGSPIPFKTRQMKSNKAIRKMVASIPNAIGYIPLSEVDDSVKVLKIDGMLPSQESYALQ